MEISIYANFDRVYGQNSSRYSNIVVCCLMLLKMEYNINVFGNKNEPLGIFSDVLTVIKE